MNEESGSTTSRQVFSADPGDRRRYLLATLACVVLAMLLIVSGIAPWQFGRVFPGLYLLAMLYPLGRRLRERSGHIEVFKDGIEKSGAGMVRFDGSETVVPIRGGYALCQGSSRIPIYRRHPQSARIEELLIERSRVFRNARKPTVPFRLSVPFWPAYSTTFSAYALPLAMLFGLGERLDKTGVDWSLIPWVVLLCLLPFSYRQRPGGLECRFELDEIVIKTRKHERHFQPQYVEFMLNGDGNRLSIRPLTGRALTLFQDDVVMSLQSLESLVERSYGMRNMEPLGNIRYFPRRSGLQ